MEFEPEGMPDTCVIPRAVELCGEDAGAGSGTEDAQVKDEKQTVDDGYTAHGNGAHLAYHDIVQKIHKIGDSGLNDYGNGDGQNTVIISQSAQSAFLHDLPQRKKNAGRWPCIQYSIDVQDVKPLCRGRQAYPLKLLFSQVPD